MTKILIVDDEKDIRDLLTDILEDEGYDIVQAGHADTAIDEVNAGGFDLIILDIWLKESHMDGLDILKYANNHSPEVPVVIISGHGNIEIAVAAIKQGAFDFIEKPFNMDQLLLVVNRALEVFELRQSVHIDQKNPVELIGDTTVMKNLRKNLDKLAKVNSRVLFRGAPGSGKETAARFIYHNSDRALRKFIYVPAHQLNSEDGKKLLYGEEENNQIKKGFLERAQGGVLYLDDVNELSEEMQSELLLVINEGSFTRIGGKSLLKTDIRYFSSTEIDLEEAVKSSTFKEALYHRLNVMTVDIPSLNQRKDDIRLLANAFAEEIVANQKLSKRTLTDETIEHLEKQDWFGNLRALRNEVERVLILEELGHNNDPKNKDEDEIGQLKELVSGLMHLPLREAREKFESLYLEAQISRYDGNISRTALEIGMERSALHRKLKSLDL